MYSPRHSATPACPVGAPDPPAWTIPPFRRLASHVSSAKLIICRFLCRKTPAHRIRHLYFSTLPPDAQGTYGILTRKRNTSLLRKNPPVFHVFRAAFLCGSRLFLRAPPTAPKKFKTYLYFRMVIRNSRYAKILQSRNLHEQTEPFPGAIVRPAAYPRVCTAL